MFYVLFCHAVLLATPVRLTSTSAWSTGVDQEKPCEYPSGGVLFHPAPPQGLKASVELTLRGPPWSRTNPLGFASGVEVLCSWWGGHHVHSRGPLRRNFRSGGRPFSVVSPEYAELLAWCSFPLPECFELLAGYSRPGPVLIKHTKTKLNYFTTRSQMYYVMLHLYFVLHTICINFCTLSLTLLCAPFPSPSLLSSVPAACSLATVGVG